ncbi:MAG: TonB-dependent receptor, partial [bacterium]|nr:TonB-dependent receptor [bacterium]
MKKSLIVLVSLMLAATSIFAIEQGGHVDGNVVLEDGKSIPGVSVELSGDNMMGTRTTVSNENGYFRFANTKVGKIKLVFELEGFKKVLRKNIFCSLGKTTTVNIMMEMGSLKEEVIVNATQPVVDMKSSTQQVNISKQAVETLANDRQYQSIMAMMPGAIPGNNPSMMGASDSDNMYQVDGMDSTDPETKTWSTSMNFDNFEEMQVIAQGASAEYGRGTGAVINVVTKSGSNKLHGTARVSVTKTDWNAKNSGDRYYSNDATKYLNETRPSINLGGPIIKDKLWFFGSWEKRNKWKPGAVFHSYEDWYNEAISETKQYYQGHYASGKLSANLGTHSLMAMWSEDPIKIPNLYAYSGISVVSKESELDRIQGGWNANSEWTSTIGSNTYVVGRFAMKRGELNNEAKNYDPVFLKGGFYSNGALSEYLTKREFEQYILNVSHFADTSFGYHDLKAGMEFMNIHNSRQSNRYPGGEFVIYGFDGVTTIERRIYTDRTDAAKKYNQMVTFFLQDKWEVAKGLTLNLGLRMESGVWKNHTKDEILKFGFGD